MIAIIEKKSEYTDAFLSWLVDDMKNTLYARVDMVKLVVLEEYYNEKYGTDFSFNQVFIQIVDNISYKTVGNSVYIQIGNYINTYILNLRKLAKYIDFGDISMKGCLLFTPVFNDVRVNIDNYYERYLLSPGGM